MKTTQQSSTDTIDWLTWVLSVILVGLIIYGIIDFRSDRRRDRAAREAEEQEVVDDVDLDSADADRSVTTTLPPSQGDIEGAPAEGGATDVQASEEAIRQRFSQGLQGLSACLDLQTDISNEPMEPTMDNFMGSVRNSLGEQVLQTEDWSSTDLVTNGGERRRLRVEMDYSGEDRIVKRLKYYVLGENGEPVGQIPLTPEQSVDPTDTFLASLESDGNPVSRERAQRIYFGGGEEIVATEKDGRILEVTMNRNGRSFRCRPSDASPESCRCL